MAKSVPMLPTLAGGSGVAAHALTDNDLLHVVDATTLNANRDRQMTLGELKAFTSADLSDALDAEIADREAADIALAATQSGLITAGGLTIQNWTNAVHVNTTPSRMSGLALTSRNGVIFVDLSLNISSTDVSPASTAKITIYPTIAEPLFAPLKAAIAAIRCPPLSGHLANTAFLCLPGFIRLPGTATPITPVMFNDPSDTSKLCVQFFDNNRINGNPATWSALFGSVNAAECVCQGQAVMV